MARPLPIAVACAPPPCRTQMPCHVGRRVTAPVIVRAPLTRLAVLCCAVLTASCEPTSALPTGTACGSRAIRIALCSTCRSPHYRDYLMSTPVPPSALQRQSRLSTPGTEYSSTPVTEHSSTPVTEYSSTPVTEYSSTPLLYVQRLPLPVSNSVGSALIYKAASPSSNHSSPGTGPRLPLHSAMRS
jgi:hypothetical protein